MALGTDVNFLQASEFIVGENHPTLPDNFNRPLKDLIAQFDVGADTQVTRTAIKIASATDIDVSVVDDDLVYYNTSTSKFEKAIDNRVLGFIDTTNLIIYTSGMLTLVGITTLTPNSKYYLDLGTPGGITTNPASNIFVGIAFSNDTILNTAGNNVSVDLSVINTALGTTTDNRYDKALSSLDVIAMIYTTGNLSTVRYFGDDNATIYYRDVMTYDGSDNLTEVKHFFGTADLITQSATTTLTYDGSNNLLTATYTE